MQLIDTNRNSPIKPSQKFKKNTHITKDLLQTNKQKNNIKKQIAKNKKQNN